MNDSFQRKVIVLFTINIIISTTLLCGLFIFPIFNEIIKKEENPNLILYDYGATLETQGQFHDITQFYSFGVAIINNGNENAKDLTVNFRIEGYSNESLTYLKVDNTILDWELEPNTVVITESDINVTQGVEVYFIQVLCNWNKGSKAWNFWMDLEPTLALEGEALFV